jgi:L-lactate utilization protein LutC
MENKLLYQFQSRIQDSGGWCEIAATAEGVCDILKSKYMVEKEKIVISGRVGKELQIPDLYGITIDEVKPNNRRALLSKAKLGITFCDGLVAETGTVVLINHPSEPRELSLLPEYHVVIAKQTQLYESLEICFTNIKQLYPAGSIPSMTLISGPSRTSDIEKTLVIGVHGPIGFGVIIIGNR